MTRMQFPPELIYRIVYFLIHESQTDIDQLGVNIKPPWSSVHGFSQVSRTFRTIFLENWFQRLYITSWDDVTSQDILMFPDIFGWAKELHCVQKPSPASTQYWTTNGLTKVRKVRLDWPCSLRPPYYSMSSSYEAAVLFFAPTGAARITDFDLRGVDYPTPRVIYAIANTFSALQRLRLTLPEIWCGLCNTCSTPNSKTLSL
ncbi:hypothetical protein BDZ89DRAFT_256311 [Hymenopellis radicata]|nr:hypothetical protein BDZ89DRAFT_256311 [Hymenopellis radicata]